MTTVDIGALDDLADGVGTRLEVEEERIAVFRVGDEIFAIADRCSHAEASSLLWLASAS